MRAGPFPTRPGGKGPRRRPAWARVRGMFAHSTRNWWWTAHPAAH
ncbi:trp operon leader peptide [Streptomyces sp. SID4923]|nr:trp operon leader peptide [Streptomyces sp. SID4923]NEC08405.1 trp operon leader peptide [Streptomyces sp. SID7909]